jgi:hypothetical protein
VIGKIQCIIDFNLNKRINNMYKIIKKFAFWILKIKTIINVLMRLVIRIYRIRIFYRLTHIEEILDKIDILNLELFYEKKSEKVYLTFHHL